MWTRFVQSLPTSSFSFRIKQRLQQISIRPQIWSTMPFEPHLLCYPHSLCPSLFSLSWTHHSNLYGSLSLKSPSFKHSWLLSHLFKCPIFITFLQSRLLSFVLYPLYVFCFSTAWFAIWYSICLFVYLSVDGLFPSPSQFHQDSKCLSSSLLCSFPST